MRKESTTRHELKNTQPVTDSHGSGRSRESERAHHKPDRSAEELRLGGQSCGRLHFDHSASVEGSCFIKRPDDRMSYEREKYALRELNSDPRIVRLQSFDDRQRELRLDIIPGPTLSEILRDEGAFSEEHASLIIRELAATLAYVHSEVDKPAFVHYDVAPSNIYWTPIEERLILADFGTSFPVREFPQEFCGCKVGTPLYMSPEKINGRPDPGRAADCFAMGAIWYELISGSPPFDPCLGSIDRQILTSDPVPLRRCANETRQWIDLLLAKDPERRPTAQHVARWLSLATE